MLFLYVIKRMFQIVFLDDPVECKSQRIQIKYQVNQLMQKSFALLGC